MLECYVHLTHRNLPNVHKYFWWTQQSVALIQCFMTEQPSWPQGSSPQTITEEKYCLIFQVVGQLTVIPYASLGGGLILNIYNKSVYPSKMCIFRVTVVLLTIVLKTMFLAHAQIRLDIIFKDCRLYYKQNVHTDLHYIRLIDWLIQQLIESKNYNTWSLHSLSKPFKKKTIVIIMVVIVRNAVLSVTWKIRTGQQGLF
jgi:hypothetical protein